jgi:hypothetical protein
MFYSFRPAEITNKSKMQEKNHRGSKGVIRVGMVFIYLDNRKTSQRNQPKKAANDEKQGFFYRLLFIRYGPFNRLDGIAVA